MLVGDTVEPILSINNTSGRRWRSTWVWVQGDSDFRIESMEMNDQQADATYRAAGQWNVGPLPRRDIGDIHIHLTAKKPGAPKVTFAIWGSSSASDSPKIPDGVRSVSCEYAIHP